MTFEPRIIAFLCTWCSYTGADTAGIARLKSPANIRAVRVPCSGRVSPELVVRAFDQGADGVLVLGCHIGECHYDSGNHRTAKRLPILRELLTFSGLEPERLRLDWVSASEGERYARITTEFSQAVRRLGPARWRAPKAWPLEHRPALLPPVQLDEREDGMGNGLPRQAEPPFVVPSEELEAKAEALRAKARELLQDGQVSCVIGYEVSPHGRTRPSFAYTPQECDRLVWNLEVSSNLTVYLPARLRARGAEPPPRVALVVKPCDSKAVNVQLAENHYQRDQVHLIGVSCDGLSGPDGQLQERCQNCHERTPLLYDTLVGTPPATGWVGRLAELDRLDRLTPAERMEYWLDQFDRCIRCYACRQACPMCNCPSCLFERDDSTFVGLGIGLNEKRTFHLGRAFHLAGRCIGCNECERACPVGLPIGLINQKLSEAVEAAFDFKAGAEPVPSPVVTVLSGEYQEGK